jgi:hypothetical protein
MCEIEGEPQGALEEEGELECARSQCWSVVSDYGATSSMSWEQQQQSWQEEIRKEQEWQEKWKEIWRGINPSMLTSTPQTKYNMTHDRKSSVVDIASSKYQVSGIYLLALFLYDIILQVPTSIGWANLVRRIP